MSDTAVFTPRESAPHYYRGGPVVGCGRPGWAALNLFCVALVRRPYSASALTDRSTLRTLTTWLCFLIVRLVRTMPVFVSDHGVACASKYVMEIDADNNNLRFFC